MTTFLIVFGSALFVAGVFVLCNCRNKNQGYKIAPGLVIGGLGCLIVSVQCFLIINWYIYIGYSANNENLIRNAVYEVVSSDQVDDRSIAILREPDGHLRFFTFRETDIADIGKIESGQFLKATGGDRKKRKLLPLTPPVSSVKAVP